jgi:4-hydroxybenzoate polyprenyltransferase
MSFLSLIVIISLSLVFPMLAYLYDRVLITEIIRDLRILRIFHYISLTGLGLALYMRGVTSLDPYIQTTFILTFCLFIISLVYAAVFAIVANNIEDLETDKISNRSRPLVTGKVQFKTYRNAGIICQIIALIMARMLSLELFYGILFISLGYYVYSCHPFRFKKIPFFAKLIIGLNSLTMALCGYTFAGGKISDFTIAWAIFILVPLSLSANFVDLKDIEGDRVMGVKTLPVLWGEKKAKHFISISTIFTYMMAGYLLHIPWVYPLILMMAFLHIRFLYAKPYNEKPIFVVFVSSIFALDIFLILSPYLI